MEKKKGYFLKERFLQSSKAFVLLEVLFSLLIFALILSVFSHYLLIEKNQPPSPLALKQDFSPSQTLILKSGNLQFQAELSIWDNTEVRLKKLHSFQ